MQPAQELVLRDIHRVPAPPLWPPAPGWWLVFALLLAVGLVLAWWLRRRRRHRRAIETLFDEALREAGDGPAQVAAMSSLLRRAARRHHADADVLDGEDWLAVLDAGAKPPLFQSAAGRLLVEGLYRPHIDAGELERLRHAARTRFLQWMGVAR